MIRSWTSHHYLRGSSALKVASKVRTRVDSCPQESGKWTGDKWTPRLFGEGTLSCCHLRFGPNFLRRCNPRRRFRGNSWTATVPIRLIPFAFPHRSHSAENGFQGFGWELVKTQQGFVTLDRRGERIQRAHTALTFGACGFSCVVEVVQLSLWTRNINLGHFIIVRLTASFSVKAKVFEIKWAQWPIKSSIMGLNVASFFPLASKLCYILNSPK